MNTSDLDIDALLKRLHLANARRVWRDLVARAETEQWSCRDFLALLVISRTRCMDLQHRAGSADLSVSWVAVNRRDGRRRLPQQFDLGSAA
jgi:hypothetical protein